MSILTICPVKEPSSYVNRMLESFDATRSPNNDIIFNSNGTVTEAINEVFKLHPHYDFYHVTNDDVIYKTPQWDLKLAKRGMITHGKDSIDEGLDGQFLMIDGDIVRAVGWLQLPTLNKYCGDVVWRFIGERLGILEYIPDVEIKHHWGGANEEENKADMSEFAKWLQKSHFDIDKIKIIL